MKGYVTESLTGLQTLKLNVNSQSVPQTQLDAGTHFQWSLACDYAPQ